MLGREPILRRDHRHPELSRQPSAVPPVRARIPDDQPAAVDPKQRRPGFAPLVPTVHEGAAPIERNLASAPSRRPPHGESKHRHKPPPPDTTGNKPSAGGQLRVKRGRRHGAGRSVTSERRGVQPGPMIVAEWTGAKSERNSNYVPEVALAGATSTPTSTDKKRAPQDVAAPAGLNARSTGSGPWLSRHRHSPGLNCSGPRLDVGPGNQKERKLEPRARQSRSLAPVGGFPGNLTPISDWDDPGRRDAEVHGVDELGRRKLELEPSAPTGTEGRNDSGATSLRLTLSLSPEGSR